jgi:prepilin-type N-terminal cleavage/methylation domain-containing protein
LAFKTGFYESNPALMPNISYDLSRKTEYKKLLAYLKEIAMNRRKGFTLIELLIVVLILGALAAIAIPKIAISSATAKKNACDTNVDIMNSQIEMYYANTGAYPADYDVFLANTAYFPEGRPVCPFTTAYAVANDRVTAHNH